MISSKEPQLHSRVKGKTWERARNHGKGLCSRRETYSVLVCTFCILTRKDKRNLISQISQKHIVRWKVFPEVFPWCRREGKNAFYLLPRVFSYTSWNMKRIREELAILDVHFRPIQLMIRIVHVIYALLMLSAPSPTLYVKTSGNPSVPSSPLVLFDVFEGFLTV